MRKLTVEVTDEEFKHLERCAARLYLRGPAQWLLLAGMNLRPSLGAPAGVRFEADPSQSSLGPGASEDSRRRLDFAVIARATKVALDAHSAELRGAAARVADDYLNAKVIGKERLGTSKHAPKWRQLLNAKTILAAYQRLTERTFGPEYPSDANERWPNRLSYAGFRDWLRNATNIDLEVKAGERSLYHFLDALRDVYVLAMRNHLSPPALTDAPHFLVVRLDRGRPGEGAYKKSPYEKA